MRDFLRAFAFGAGVGTVICGSFIAYVVYVTYYQ